MTDNFNRMPYVFVRTGTRNGIPIHLLRSCEMSLRATCSNVDNKANGYLAALFSTAKRILLLG